MKASPWARHAAGVLIVYDVCDRQSFDHVERWLSDIRSQGSEDCEVFD